MPHGAKWVMDTTTNQHVYNVARFQYLDKKFDLPYRGWKPYRKDKKKRKWLAPRSYAKLPPPIPNETIVLVKNPWPYQSWNFPTTKGDYADDYVLGRVVGFRPPGKIWSPYKATVRRYREEFLFSRHRKYKVVLMIGSSKGRELQYAEDQIQIVPPEEIPSLLFLMQILVLKGQL